MDKIKIQILDGAGAYNGKVIELSRGYQKKLKSVTITHFDKPVTLDGDFIPAVNMYFYRPENVDEKAEMPEEKTGHEEQLQQLFSDLEVQKKEKEGAESE